VIFHNQVVDKNEVLERPRTAARIAAVQAIYQITMTNLPADEVVKEFTLFRLQQIEGDSNLGVPDLKLFEILVKKTAKELNELDRLIADVLVETWTMDRLENTLQAILRVGACELLRHLETPPAVVISEYVDVTHAFYEDKMAALVNGVLDKLGQENRKKTLG
tara:strand:+ start:30 stop:518 length:489 start_codon:yes stop_codon:yes gene_type:complete